MRVEARTILAASAAVVVMVAALAPRAIHAQASSPVRGRTVRELRVNRLELERDPRGCGDGVPPQSRG